MNVKLGVAVVLVLLWPVLVTAAPEKTSPAELYQLTEADYAKDGHTFWFVRDFLMSPLHGYLQANMLEPEAGLELWVSISVGNRTVHVEEFNEHDVVVAGYDLAFTKVDTELMKFWRAARKIRRVPATLVVEYDNLEHSYLITKIPGMDDQATWEQYAWTLPSKYMLTYVGSSGINRSNRIYK